MPASRFLLRFASRVGLGLASLADPARAQSPDISQVLERAGQFVATLEANATAVTADESYVQTADLQRGTGASNFGGGAGERGVGGTGIVEFNTRRLKRQSHAQVLVWFRPSKPPAWGTARHLVDVDGQAAKPPAKTFADAAAGGAQVLASQWNTWCDAGRVVHLGAQVRDVASPFYALMVLRDAVRPAIEFKKAGEETLGGVRAWKISFSERSFSVSRLEGMPASPLHGAFWIDPVDGRVLRSRVEVGDKLSMFQVRSEVDYRKDAALDMWLPSELRERYDSPEGKVEGKASYSGYRRLAMP